SKAKTDRRAGCPPVPRSRRDSPKQPDAAHAFNTLVQSVRVLDEHIGRASHPLGSSNKDKDLCKTKLLSLPEPSSGSAERPHSLSPGRAPRSSYPVAATRRARRL